MLVLEAQAAIQGMGQLQARVRHNYQSLTVLSHSRAVEDNLFNVSLLVFPPP